MKKVTRAGILSLVFVFTFMFITASSEVATAGRFIPPTERGHVRTQGIQIQPKHVAPPFLDLNKHELTLKKGKSETLKAFLNPSGKSTPVYWASVNPQIAKIDEKSGKVTAVAPGTTMVWASSEKYWSTWDETGSSQVCYVTVQGGVNDPKPLDTDDWMYNYGEKQFTAPTSNYSKEIANVKKSIGGNSYSKTDEYDMFRVDGLIYGSAVVNKAHTNIFIFKRTDGEDFMGYGFFACEKSPIKTNRGINVGAKKSTVQQKYGIIPYLTSQYTDAGKTYDVFCYETKVVGKSLFTVTSFIFPKSKDTVSNILFYLGGDFQYWKESIENGQIPVKF